MAKSDLSKDFIFPTPAHIFIKSKCFVIAVLFYHIILIKQSPIAMFIIVARSLSLEKYTAIEKQQQRKETTTVYQCSICNKTRGSSINSSYIKDIHHNYNNRYGNYSEQNVIFYLVRQNYIHSSMYVCGDPDLFPL